MEAKLSSPNGIKNDVEKMEAKKAFNKFVREGKDALNEAEKKFMRTDVNTQGGYLVPDEYLTELLKNITEISNIRSVARTYKTSAGSVVIPTRTGLVDVSWANEGEATSDSQSSYGELKIDTHRLTGVVHVTNEMLNDSVFDIEGLINSDVAEKMAQAEGNAFLLGNGTGKPEGILNNLGATLTSSTAGDYNGDDLVKLSAELKTGYKPIFSLNKKQIAKIRQLKTTTGDYIWTPSLDASNPNTILGYPYIELPDMTKTNNTGEVPILFGDFKMGYMIIDRIALAVTRDPMSLAHKGIVRFVFHRYVGGAVSVKEAFAGLKIQ